MYRMKTKLLVVFLSILGVISQVNAAVAEENADMCIAIFPEDCSVRAIKALQLDRICLEDIIHFCRKDLSKKERKTLRRYSEKFERQELSIQPIDSADPIL